MAKSYMLAIISVMMLFVAASKDFDPGFAMFMHIHKIGIYSSVILLFNIYSIC